MLRRTAPCILRSATQRSAAAIRAVSAVPRVLQVPVVHKRFATVGSEGSDSDFAPQKKTPPPSGRDTQAEIKDMVENRKVVLFMKGVPDQPQCGFSNRAVQILDHHRAVYGAFNVLADPEIREGVKQYSAWPTIPQLFVNGEFVGGCDIMMEMHQSGELKTLLEEAGGVKA
mmetsp:Transcript_11147/g.26076  ORF Transcript_11147/g.26076 Transcript_11147/m.26076 type:complete len:171 (+) Transcript_11147:30-542(+)